MSKKKEETAIEAPTTAVAVKEETSLVEGVSNVQSRAMTLAKEMQELGVTAQDLVIPKLLLMQPTSEYVGADKAKVCDIVNSQTQEVIAGPTSPIEIVPLKMYKTWRISDMSEQPPKFMRNEPFTSDNANASWEGTEVVDGEEVPIRRDLCLNFFCLLKKDIENNEAFPVVVTFKRTSAFAGKTLATHLFMMVTLRRKPYSKSVQLKVKKEQKEKNTYAVFEIGQKLELSKEHQAVAEEWLGNLASMNYKVDDTEDDADANAAPAAEVKPTVVGAVVGGGSAY
jgi:hypothetical protein